MDRSCFLEAGSFLAIGTGGFILKMLINADEMEAMSACKGGNFFVELGETDGAGRDLV